MGSVRFDANRRKSPTNTGVDRLEDLPDSGLVWAIDAEHKAFASQSVLRSQLHSGLVCHSARFCEMACYVGRSSRHR